MSAPDLPASRRKHTSSACVPCRESKIKCDGVLPICSSCQNKNRPCQYQAGEDKRRLSHRMVVEILAGRVDELYHFIRQNSLDAPALTEEKQASLMKALSHLRLSSAITNKEGLITRDAPPASTRSAERNGCVPTQSAESDTHLEPIDLIGPCLANNDFLSSFPGDGGVFESTSREAEISQGIETSLVPGAGVVGSLDGGTLQGSIDFAEDPFRAHHETFELNGVDLTVPGGGFFGLSDQNYANPGFATQEDLPPQPRKNPPVSDDTEMLIQQLSDRIGSLRIGLGGQVRYCTPTSNFNLVDMGAPDNLTVHRTLRTHGPEYLERLGIGKRVPGYLEDHLINLYFSWQNPAFYVVKRGMYEEAKSCWRDKLEDTSYFSEALQNAMCSLGAAFEARHYPTFPTFPKSLADFFADRAKVLLEIELDTPTVATVQALVILSSHDIGCKRDSRGWLYSGMATRLAFHLALHLDMSSYVQSNSITREEADLRRDVFWAAYTVDHIWGFHLGRAFRVNMESVTVGTPEADRSADPVDRWAPYINQASLVGTDSVPDPTVETHKQRVLLCEIMAPLGFALYGNLKTPLPALHQLNVSTVKKLFAWKANLPPVLQVNPEEPNSAQLPHVLLLHMLYYQNVIYSHRPWMHRRGGSGSSLRQAGVRHDPEHARAMCFGSATAIARLLQAYEARWGLRRINVQAVGITCSAALLLIFAIVIRDPAAEGGSGYDGGGGGGASNSSRSNDNDDDDNNDDYYYNDDNDNNPDDDPAIHLGTCFRALDEFGAAWESAKQALEFLTLLQRRWELQARHFRKGGGGRPGSSPATDSGGDGSGTTVPRKRSLRREPTPGLERRAQARRSWVGAGGGSLDEQMNLDLDWMLMGGGTGPGEMG